MLPYLEDFEEYMEKFDIEIQDVVVIYDEYNVQIIYYFISRIKFTLKVNLK